MDHQTHRDPSLDIISKSVGRRRFLRGVGALAAGVVGAQLLAACAAPAATSTPVPAAAATTAPAAAATTAPAAAATTAPAAAATTAPKPTAAPVVTPVAVPTVAPVLVQPTASTAPQMFPGPEKANIDWKQFSGTEIRWLGGQHPVSETLIKMAPDFQALTGIKVNVEQVDWTAFDTKRNLDLASPNPQYDTYMAMYQTDWQFGSQGLLADQNPYLNDPKLTDKEWLGLDDISTPLQESAIWDGVAGHPLGKGKRFSIPYMIETYILAYRADILDKAGVKLDKPVAIQEDMPGICDKIKTYDKSLTPIAFRGSGGSINAVWMSELPNYGGGDFDAGMNSRWGEPVMVKLVDTIVNKIAKPYSAPGWPTLSWDTLRNKFITEAYAMVWDCDFFSTLYEEDPQSKIKGKLKYQLVGGPSSQLSGLFYFGNCIAQNSKKKEQAWLFNEWLISKQGQRDWAVKYKNLIPTRQSVWSDPDMNKWVGGWGGGTWLDCVKQNVGKNVKIFMTPFADYGSVVTELENSIAAVYNGKASDVAMKELVTKVNAITDKAKVRQPNVH